MIKILKYELRRRRNTIITLCGIMAGLSIGTLLMTIFGHTVFGDSQNTTFHLWNALTFIGLVFIPSIAFFTCSNGHVDELLYKDTNYLMLTIPIKSHEILLGRIIAGFIELVIYSVSSFVLGISIIALNLHVHAARMGLANNFDLANDTSFFSIWGAVLKHIFIFNPLPLIYFLFTVIAGFLLVGTVFMCVKALTRSFIRKKQLGQIVAVILFIVIFNQVLQLGNYLSQEWNLIQYLNIKLVSFNNGMYSIDTKSIPVYLVSSIFTLLAAGLFFGITNWLFDKKVEL